jgi:hypothetical protein
VGHIEKQWIAKCFGAKREAVEASVA